MTKVFGKYGIQFEMGNLEDTQTRKKLFDSGATMLWIESPTNPLLKTVDLPTIIQAAKQKNIIVVVDNTFATPYHQQPLLM
jgi:cystathionine beta-lyase/cystathionine gamma-synthase